MLYLYSKSLYICLEARCEPVPAVANAYPSTRITNEGTVVSYKCNPGYSTNVLGPTLEARCVQGQWNITDNQCRSEIMQMQTMQKQCKMM